MKLLKFWLNGRPRTWDDLKNLQDQVGTVESAFGSAGAFIFTGCEVTPNGSKFNVSPGLVYLDGKLMQFDGAVNVDLPIEIYAAAPVESDPRPDSNQNAQFAQVEYKATYRTSIAGELD